MSTQSVAWLISSNAAWEQQVLALNHGTSELRIIRKKKNPWISWALLWILFYILKKKKILSLSDVLCLSDVITTKKYKSVGLKRKNKGLQCNIACSRTQVYLGITWPHHKQVQSLWLLVLLSPNSTAILGFSIELTRLTIINMAPSLNTTRNPLFNPKQKINQFFKIFYLSTIVTNMYVVEFFHKIYTHTHTPLPMQLSCQRCPHFTPHTLPAGLSDRHSATLPHYHCYDSS